MRIWIDIENASEEKQGDGPIISALGWVDIERLDRAGEFRFTMPVTDPRAALCQHKYRAKCYGFVNGATTLLGAGIIEKKRVVISPDGVPLLEVAGPGIVAELSFRSVGFLEIGETIAIHPDWAEEVTPSGGTHLANALDGNTATGSTVTLQGGEYIYVGHDLPFPYVDWDIGTTVNGNAGTVNAQYFHETIGWNTVSGFNDTTVVSGASWAQDGRMSWDTPSGQVKVTHNDMEKYWMRFSYSVNSQAFDIREITIAGRGPSTDDLDDIMAFAPAGWSLDTGDWYGSTENGTYSYFAGESVLAALIKTAEKTGEHFRLGDGLEIEWLQKDQPISGVRATNLLGNDPIAIESNTDICLITSLEELEDSAGLITRIYPFGAGNGEARVTLDNTTESAPTGYTLDTTNNYIKANTPETTYGRIESYVSFKEIRALDLDANGAEKASNELFTAALEHLQKREAPEKFYRLSVTKLDQELRPGETIRVVYREVVDTDSGTYTAIDIDEDLIVLETTTVVDSSGIRTTDLMVSTIDRWPVTDDEIIASQFDQGQVYEAHPQPVEADKVVMAPSKPRNTGWSTSNVSADKSLDVSALTLSLGSVQELGNLVGTLIGALKELGHLGD